MAPLVRQPVRLAAAAALTALALVGCASTAPPAPVSGPAPAVASAPAEPAVPAPRATAITIPAIDAQSTLVPVGLRADGTLDVPSVEQPEQAAFYSGAPMPGAPGPALVVGHVNGGGRDGVFARLDELAVGDEVFVDREQGGPVRFVVTGSERVAKDAFPWESVLAQTPDAELRLVTCSGSFDRSTGHYVDNTVVFAVAVAVT
jgi:LPXTG-site transpeptidase (sortase) family protein